MTIVSFLNITLLIKIIREGLYKYFTGNKTFTIYLILRLKSDFYNISFNLFYIEFKNIYFIKRNLKILSYISAPDNEARARNGRKNWRGAEHQG